MRRVSKTRADDNRISKKGLFGNVLAQMGNNEFTSMKNLERIYTSMSFTLTEVIEFKENDQ